MDKKNISFDMPLCEFHYDECKNCIYYEYRGIWSGGHCTYHDNDVSYDHQACAAFEYSNR